MVLNGRPPPFRYATDGPRATQEAEAAIDAFNAVESIVRRSDEISREHNAIDDEDGIYDDEEADDSRHGGSMRPSSRLSTHSMKSMNSVGGLTCFGVGFEEGHAEIFRGLDPIEEGSFLALALLSLSLSLSEWRIEDESPPNQFSHSASTGDLLSEAAAHATMAIGTWRRDPPLAEAAMSMLSAFGAFKPGLRYPSEKCGALWSLF